MGGAGAKSLPKARVGWGWGLENRKLAPTSLVVKLDKSTLLSKLWVQQPKALAPRAQALFLI